MLEPGDEVAGLRIIREVGRGTTSLIYEVEPVDGGNHLAIKVLLPGLGDDPIARRRFERGLKAQSSLSHDGIVPVLDHGDDEAGNPWVSMPLYTGGSLADLLEDGGVPPAELLDLLTLVAAGLDAAHQTGILHRDVKPSNILIEGNRAALADFGLAREETDPGETVTGTVLGTLACIAPEVVAGKHASPASDRYGFAAVIVEGLTGQTVFPRTSDAAVLYAHAELPPPSIMERRPELPAAVDPVIASALSKDPEFRPATAAELIKNVRQALGPGVTRLGPAPRRAGLNPDDETHDPDPAPRQARSGRYGLRHREMVAVLVIAVVAALAGGALLLNSGDDSSSANTEIPALADGHVALGSELSGEAFESVDCEGNVAGPNSPACTVMQRKLPGRPIQAPSDGAIRSWSVRGADGELALQVLRERDGRFFQVFRSQSTVVPDEGVHTFPVELALSAGDYVSLAVSPDTAIGVRTGVAGAQTNRFFGPVGPDVPPGKGPGTGFDHELMLRVDYEPGGIPVPPKQVVGDDAKDLPDGNVIAVDDAALPDGRLVKVTLTEVDDEVFVDLERNGVRRSRIVVPDLRAGGRMVEFKAFESPGSDSQLNVGWLNKGDRRPIEHYFGLDAESLVFYS